MKRMSVEEWRPAPGSSSARELKGRAHRDQKTVDSKFHLRSPIP